MTDDTDEATFDVAEGLARILRSMVDAEGTVNLPGTEVDIVASDAPGEYIAFVVESAEEFGDGNEWLIDHADAILSEFEKFRERLESTVDELKDLVERRRREMWGTT